MNVLLAGSTHDQEMALRIEYALSAAGHGAAVVYPDAEAPAVLPSRVLALAQVADYFLFLVSRHTAGAHWLERVTPEHLAPLCAAGVRIMLVVFNEGIPPSGLACVPCLYLLDEQTVPALVDGLVESLELVHGLLPAEIDLLRYGINDLEAFLETAQALAFAYTGLASAWDELAVHLSPDQDLPVEQALFHRYAANIGAGISLHVSARLEKRVQDQPGGGGLLGRILRDYQALERDWQELTHSYLDSSGLAAAILRARTRAAAFINLVFLVMTLQLLPYCEQYLHMQGLKQLEDVRHPAAPPDPAQARLFFLIAQFGQAGSM